ncbi:MAG TPA: SAV_915 family protein [Pseudonocardiaceae bacterium]|nr:SAV_915 family protein [Pseudonocardiaceae bacterium]
MTREPSDVQAPTLLYVPAYPHTEGGRQDIVFELRTSAAGDVVAVAFTSKAKLVDSLGRFQPWVGVSQEKFQTFIGAIGVREVIVDPQIDASLRRIDMQQLRQFVGRP